MKMRRGSDTEHYSKLMVVSTVCILAIALGLTVCIQSLRGDEITGGLKELCFLFFTALLGILTNTRSEQRQNVPPPSGREIGEGIQQASEENPIQTSEVDSTKDKDGVPYADPPTRRAD